MAYEGNKYRTDELVPLVAHTEMGINQADVISGHRLIDRHVEEALERLVVAMRDDTLPPFELRESVSYIPGQEVDLISYMIRHSWEELFMKAPEPSKDDQIGVLRTLLGSINTFTTRSPTSRGYLEFIAGFLRRAGLVMPEMEEEGPPDPLVEAGEAWVLDGDDQARTEFLRLARQMITAGQGMHVAEVAQFLMGQADGPVQRELSHLSLEAQNS